MKHMKLSKKNTILILFIGILITMIAIVYYLIPDDVSVGIVLP